MTWVVIASGHSLTKEQVELVKAARDSGRIKGVIAVSNVGLDKAPWADALVSHDSKWWHSNLEAFAFKGRKFCRMMVGRLEQYIPSPPQACNSGYMAMQVARDVFKAQRVLLLGFDMHGTHYFGNHPAGLKNPTPQKFAMYLRQFEGWQGPAVLNCTPDSALKLFPFVKIENAL